MPKQKIAILGGGIGALSTALELTNVEGWQDRYDITVYQIGWRLGGKGASGRDRKNADRILEHGVHLWMGFYENAFRAIKCAYDECRENNLMPGSPFQTYHDAFAPMDFTVVMEQFEGRWTPWCKSWPRTDQWPGENDPPPGVNDWPSIVWHAVKRLVKTVVIEVESTITGGLPQNFRLNFLQKLAVRIVLWPLRAAFKHIGSLHENPACHAPEERKEAMRLLDRALKFFQVLAWILEKLFERNVLLRRIGILMDTATAMVRGIIEDNLLFRKFEEIDEEEFSAWLARHGCKEPVNPVTLGFYDACFAYKRGTPDSKALNMAAGTMLNGMLRLLLTYNKSIMLWMEAGMGDTIFSPLYLVLKHRGVRFEFFHKVTNLSLTSDGQSVAAIDVDVQATPKDPEKGYDPLYQVNGVYCWPSEPFYEQLKEGKALHDSYPNNDLESYWSSWKPVARKTLKLGEDFDLVVFGLSLGAVPYVAQELVEANPKWRAMVDNVLTVRTQAFQLWLRRTTRELGWNPGPTESPILDGWVEPFDTWADMSHLIPRENWPAIDPVKSIAYFCNAMPEDPRQAPFTDPAYPGTQLAVVRANADAFLDQHMQDVWPRCEDPRSPGRFNPDIVVSAFHRANIDPTELYVLSVAGSTKHRIPPHESGFRNLFPAGDWTLTHFNIGCVECAVQSGMLASYGICGSPATCFGPYAVPFPITDLP
jgi:uncharacterized protein with NAD-binding domain and iron-sulfur cluster